MTWGYVAPDGKEYAIIGSTMAVNIFDVTNCVPTCSNTSL